MKILVIDIGGTSVKLLATGQDTRRKFPSGPTLTAQKLIAGVNELTKDWSYDVITLGYPGVVQDGHIVAEPQNLAPGWIGVDFETAFGRPVKIFNDAGMQALGSYRGGTLLFLGLGTGLGSALVVDGVVVPMDWGNLAYRKSTFEDYVGRRGLNSLGRKRWQQHVERGVVFLVRAFSPDDVVIGGGNANKLLSVPEGCRLGDNRNAFIGGFRLWEDGARPANGSLPTPPASPTTRPRV